MSYAPAAAAQEAPAPAAAQAAESSELRGPRTYRIAELLFVLIAVAISAAAYVLVGLGTSDSVPADVYEYTFWLAGLGIGLHIVTWWRAKYADPVLVPIAVLLNGLGLAMIFRLDIAADKHQADSQMIWMTLGCILAAAVVIVMRDHRILRRWIYLSGLAAIVLLLLPLVPGLGTTVHGAKIWISVGPFSFQPGEVAKLLLAAFFAGYLVNYRDQLALAGKKVLGLRLPRLRDTGPIAIAWLASVGILVFQRDLGTSLLFFGLFVAMLYIATGVKSWIALGTLLFVGGSYVAYLLFDHVQQRVDGWLHALDPEVFNRQAGGSYQLVQGLFGMANGGLMGTGFGEGRPQTVPFANSDFIFASLGEEMGLVGLFAILALYLIFFERGMKTALMLRDGFGTLLAAGLSFTFAWQTFIVVGGVTRVIPLTGLTTPFLAAGGSSLVANWIIVGLLLRMSDNARRPVTEIPTGVLPVLRDEDDSPRRRARRSSAAEAPAASTAGSAGAGPAGADAPVAADSAAGAYHSGATGEFSDEDLARASGPDDDDAWRVAGSARPSRAAAAPQAEGGPAARAGHPEDEAPTSALPQHGAQAASPGVPPRPQEAPLGDPEEAATTARPAVRSRNRMGGEDQ
ncbi:FtsW/RodA/SpoVE family cell cycle protein [Brevibacterium sp. 5221]|uniref:FtsW/RodA/SpoVE family cell cycle protein n=1 Tax=Brevibacterium rongguiense TaxID=2695267 RepID=A0A6N9H3H9_9MICO|nr:FtsW/RodA/SpoVE family cell cycle protein [Brevibacterium rongguiense]MYM18588.1 FtsW/RodA/SpoVE family cell cycle protein [Brevibacterium rongguiense]